MVNDSKEDETAPFFLVPQIQETPSERSHNFLSRKAIYGRSMQGFVWTYSTTCHLINVLPCVVAFWPGGFGSVSPYAKSQNSWELWRLHKDPSDSPNGCRGSTGPLLEEAEEVSRCGQVWGNRCWFSIDLSRGCI